MLPAASLYHSFAMQKHSKKQDAPFSRPFGATENDAQKLHALWLLPMIVVRNPAHEVLRPNTDSKKPFPLRSRALRALAPCGMHTAPSQKKRMRFAPSKAYKAFPRIFGKKREREGDWNRESLADEKIFISLHETVQKTGSGREVVKGILETNQGGTRR